MERRELLAAGLGILALARTARADDNKAPTAPKDLPPVPATLLEAIANCIVKAQACTAHCQSQLASGHTEFARCAAAVEDVLVVSWGAHSLISRRSPSSKKMADLCAAVCKECSAACLEHKEHFAHNMHLECKACMEACDATIKACAAYVAS